MNKFKKTLLALSITALSGSALAAGDVMKSVASNFEGYASLGLSSISGGYDSSFGIKGGVNFGKDLFGIKNLGATAYVARTSSDYGAYGWKYEVTIFDLAGAATYTYPVNAKLAVQGRAGLAYEKLDVTCSGYGYYWCGGSTSGIDPVFGGGAAYQLNDKISVRADVDILGDWNLFSAGIGVKF